MEFNQSPSQYGEQRRKNILAHFGEQDNVEKAMSKDDFNAKYGVGHDVHTIHELSAFEVAAKEADGNTEEVSKAIQEEFSTFTPILVKGTESGMETVYVRESKAEASEEEGKTGIDGLEALV